MGTDRSGERRVAVVETPRTSLRIKTHVRIVRTIRSEIWGEIVALYGVASCNAELKAHET